MSQDLRSARYVENRGGGMHLVADWKAGERVRFFGSVYQLAERSGPFGWLAYDVERPERGRQLILSQYFRAAEQPGERRS